MNIGKVIKYIEETAYGEVKRTHKVNEIDIEAFKIYKSKKFSMYFEFDIFVSKHDVESDFFKDIFEEATVNLRKQKLKKLN